MYSLPTDNSYLLRLPDNMIGKHVEVIAFELKKPALEDNETKDVRNQKIAEISEIFKDSLLDLSNSKHMSPLRGLRGSPLFAFFYNHASPSDLYQPRSGGRIIERRSIRCLGNPEGVT